MGNRLGVHSSHTPEKSMAQRQSFPVHKKQQKLAPCVTTHGASFFPVQGLPRCKPIYDFPLPGTCCRLFYRPRRGVCHLQATRGALYVFFWCTHRNGRSAPFFCVLQIAKRLSGF